MSLIPMGGAKIALNPAVVEQFPDAYIPMGNTAENVARQFGVSRGDQDAFALASHQKAVAAQTRGDFAAEILPVKTRVFDGEVWRDITVDKDEGPRADTSLEKLAALKPAFDPTGSVTAGNSSPLNDGAAAVVLMGADKAKAAGKKPRAYFRAFAVAGVPPEIMGIGPVPAVRKLLAKTGLKIDQIDLFEVNEAFASQALYCVRELGLAGRPRERQRRRHRPRAPAGRDGRAPDRDRAARARAPQGPLRRHLDVRRRRHGRGRPDRARGVAA